MDIREQILSESYKLFHHFGIKSVTMDDIAKKLSMSKKTLYKYFSNKKDLVFHIMETQIKNTEDHCINVCSNAENAIHELLMVMEMIKQIFHNMNPSLLFDVQKYHPKTWQLMEDHQNGFIHDMIGKTLGRGIEEGLFRKNLNIKILTKLRLEEMRSSFNPETFPSTEYNIEEVQIVMMEHFILGITTLKGHELAIEYQNRMKN